MSKRTKVVLIVAALAAAGYIAYRLWKNRQGSGTGDQDSGLGANLNSVAPELVGGSSGPQVGPAVAMPLNITLQETAPAGPQDDDDDDDDDMDKDHHHKHHPHHRQRHAAAKVSDQRGGPGKAGLTGGHDPVIGGTGVPFNTDEPDDSGDTPDVSDFTMDNAEPSFTQGAY